MTRLLVTGGAHGYLGTELVRQARAAGLDAVGTGRADFDIRDEDAVERALAALRPDAVVNTAYVLNGPDVWSTSAEGAGLVARAAARHRARLVHMSTDLVFDGSGRPGGYRESDPVSPLIPYGEAKAAAEILVAGADRGALIVRTSLLYGGETPSNHEQLVLDAADGRAEIGFFTDEIRSPVSVRDLAAAILALVPTDRGGPVHLAGADAVSRYEFARLVAAAHGRDPDSLASARSADTGVRRPLDCSLHASLPGVRTVLAR